VAQQVNPVDPGSDEAPEIRREFRRRVTMSAAQLRDWLDTDESKAAGQKDGGGESVGHESGRRILAILGKKAGELDADDLAHMKKVNGYIARHLAQRPDTSDDELRDSAWAHSLKNWGHDPLSR
jgi:hypothetical protein